MANRLVLVLGDLYIPDRAPDIPAKFKQLLTPGKIGQILFLGNLTSPSAYAYLRSIAPDVQLVRGELDLDGIYPTAANGPGPGPGQPTAGGQQQGSGGGGASGGGGLPANIPVSKVVQHGGLRIGFTHGHTIVPHGDPDALLIAARHMDVDVLCWGGTSRFEAYEVDGKFFVNPGSATGAESWDWQPGADPDAKPAADDPDADGEAVPSFCLFDVQGDVLTLYIYQLKTDKDGAENVSVEKVSFRKEAEQPVAAATAAAVAAA